MWVNSKLALGFVILKKEGAIMHDYRSVRYLL